LIFATAPPPCLAAVLRESIRILQDDPGLQERLASLVRCARQELSEVLGFVPSASQIQPIVVGEEARALEIAQALQQNGFDVRAIRPPSVPPGTSRLRISITLNVDEAAIAQLAEALHHEMVPV